MMRVVLLLQIVMIPGVQGLTGPSVLSVNHGDSLEVTCYYDSYYDNYKKYWCRGGGRTSCNIIVQSDGCRDQDCRSSIVDNPTSHRFTVTTLKMRPRDSDTYHCGIEMSGLDHMYPVKVSVLPGVCHKSSVWEPLVEFPVGFHHIKEKEEVEVSCREQFENRSFHLICREDDDEFRLYAETPGIPCKRRCVRMINWGQNVSVYPEQEYYDPEQEVTVTCLAGYQPNYGTIKCVRDNDTNTWNVTEISCQTEVPPKVLTGTEGNMAARLRNILGSCVVSLILPMAVKLITILVYICVISVRRMKRRDCPEKKEDDSSYKMKTVYKKDPVCDIFLSTAKSSHEVIYDNMDTMINPYIKSSSC